MGQALGEMLARFLLLMLAATTALLSCGARAEDGYDLWLRYRPLPAPALQQLRGAVSGVVPPRSPGPVLQAALAELDRGWQGMTGGSLQRHAAPQEGSLLIGTAASLPPELVPGLSLQTVGDEGYVLRRLRHSGRDVTVIAANSERGLLYGSFALLARLQRLDSLTALDERSAPRISLRMLDHWDNLDGHVERGYAGESLWDWWKLPDVVSPRYRDYARANASVGINGTVLNNVNAVADILRPEYLRKTRALADELRPYGIRVFLSVRFSSPIELGGLSTADPLDAQVRDWWRRKAGEIYALIPDFGGFLVKANSEGQPGPADYGRSHAEGANALADALRPHGGIVLWRAFIYSEKDATDRTMQAYRQLQNLDGRFAANVVLQVKNGPLDFQPREPFHPLFGAMPATRLGLELQITKEYLGFATHLAYLGTLFEEVLRADTLRQGPGSTVGKILAAAGAGPSVIAGVANTGRDRNWCGSHFDQANWFAFGRLAWNPQASAGEVAREWVQRTFSSDARTIDVITGIMLGSREAVVDYMTPMGLAHLMGTGHHYGPAPWVADLARPEWNPAYYHRADAGGIGFDRTATGSNAVSQYAPPLAAQFSDAARTPPELLLWFHHLPWDARLQSGRQLWEELLHHYDRGVAQVAAWRQQWAGLSGAIDAERHAEVASMLGVQWREARWWRDASIAYWQSVSGRALPDGLVPPEFPLAHYQALSFPHAPGR